MNFSSYTWTWFLIVLVSCRQPEVHQAPQKIIDSVKVNAKSGQMLKKYIVFFGNSITAGLGLDPSESFPAQIQSRLDSLHLPYQVVNAGVSGETSADGVSRIDWILQQPVFIFVLELGGNDGLRGIAPEESKKNLDTIIVRVLRKYPDAKIIVAGMKMPPSMGQRYTRQFQSIFSDLARKNKVLLLPFLLQGVGGIDSLNQKDGIHPTAAGARIIADNIWNLLKPLL
jgi:acyl-CoA thioesterase-1